MPVQFICSHCRRTLSVTRRKAGTSVVCPKCGQSTVVPLADGPPSDVVPVVVVGLGDSTVATAPPAPTPPPASAPTAVSQPLVSEVGAFDDIPDLIGDIPDVIGASETVAAVESAASVPAPPPPPQAASPADAVRDFQFTESIAPTTERFAQTRRGRQPHGTVLLITRQAVYAHAGLTAVLLVIAFLAGLFIGRGSRPETSTSKQGKTTAEPVALGGHVLYALSPGESLPDEGALVIALPADRKPDVKIATDSLDADDEANASVDSLGEIGAALARSDANGQFLLVVPCPGNYSLLIISSHATRPDGATLPMADGEELSKYFASPSKLIGQNRYALSVRRLAGSPPALTHEFGPTDKR